MTVSVFLNHIEPGTKVSFIGTNYSIYFVTGTETDTGIRRLIGRADIENFSINDNILYCSVDDFFYKTAMSDCAKLVSEYIKYPMGSDTTK